MPVDIAQILGSSLVSLLLSVMLLKAWLPFAPRRPGTVLLEVRLQLLQRLLVHRTQAIIVLLYIIVGSLPGLENQWFLPGTQASALIGLALVAMLPLRYVFSDQGVALNNGVPRSYKNFRRVEVRPGRRWLSGTATLILRGKKLPKGTAPSYMLFLPTTGVPAATRMLKRHVR